MSDRYNIVRFYNPNYREKGKPLRVMIRRDVSLEEAQKHCSSDDTHRCTYEPKLGKVPVWFDGFEKA